PTAKDIYNKLSRWYNIVDNDAAKNNNELAILKAFQSADAIIPTLATELPILFPKDKLT
ncbi:28674_t:CDS:1, partial [Racocetra persica]